MKRTPITRAKVGLLAKVLRSKHPVRGTTDPLVAVEWFETVRDVAQVFFPVGSDEWYEFMGEAGYFESK